MTVVAIPMDTVVALAKALGAALDYGGYADGAAHPDACRTNPTEISGAAEVGQCDCWVGEALTVLGMLHEGT